MPFLRNEACLVQMLRIWYNSCVIVGTTRHQPAYEFCESWHLLGEAIYRESAILESCKRILTISVLYLFRTQPLETFTIVSSFCNLAKSTKPLTARRLQKPLNHFNIMYDSNKTY